MRLELYCDLHEEETYTRTSATLIHWQYLVLQLCSCASLPQALYGVSGPCRMPRFL